MTHLIIYCLMLVVYNCLHCCRRIVVKSRIIALNWPRDHVEHILNWTIKFDALCLNIVLKITTYMRQKMAKSTYCRASIVRGGGGIDFSHTRLAQCQWVQCVNNKSLQFMLVDQLASQSSYFTPVAQYYMLTCGRLGRGFHSISLCRLH